MSDRQYAPLEPVPLAQPRTPPKAPDFPLPPGSYDAKILGIDVTHEGPILLQIEVTDPTTQTSIVMGTEVGRTRPTPIHNFRAAAFAYLQEKYQGTPDEQLVTEYVEEAEHQEGQEYWYENFRIRNAEGEEVLDETTLVRDIDGYTNAVRELRASTATVTRAQPSRTNHPRHRRARRTEGRPNVGNTTTDPNAPPVGLSAPQVTHRRG